MKTTIVIPTRNELYLNETIEDIYAKATGDIEVIVFFDDCWNLPLPKDRPNLTIVHSSKRVGLRGAINAASEIGRGDYLLKLDAHVMLSPGFDEALQADCDKDWLVVPKRYSLDADAWQLRTDKPPVQYEYLSYPIKDGNHMGMHATYWWKERDRAREAFDVDENMSSQGSLWFMPMDYFRRLIYPMDSTGYGGFMSEMQEIGLKVWLGGGKNMLNKKVWYAHLWKGKGYREKHLERIGIPYTRIGSHEMLRGLQYTTDFWFYNRWQQRIHDLDWLVDRFWPVPTWPENRELWTHLPTL